MDTCGQTAGGGWGGCLGRLCAAPLDEVGTMTTGSDCCVVGVDWDVDVVFLPPVNILTVLCKKSVFWAAAAVLWWAGFEPDDIEWHRTTKGPEPEDQSLPLQEEDEEDEGSTPAELDRYGGGDSLSNTVRFGGGRMHFW